jgi:glycerophosphoryl diester phosphodiesterase
VSSRLSQIKVHGHRGARALFPENSLVAFQYACRLGVDALELDLAVTRDDVLVVSHDPVLGELWQGPDGVTRVIRELTFADLRQWRCDRANPAFPHQQAIPGTQVPSFIDVLALANEMKFPGEFNVETKIFRDRPHLAPSPAEFAQLVHSAAAQAKILPRLILQSFDFRTLEAMKQIDPAIRLSALFDRGETDLVERTLAIGAHIISPHHSLATPELVTAAHTAGLQVIPWTVNNPTLWQQLADAGVDAVITDDPSALLAWLHSNAAQP